MDSIISILGKNIKKFRKANDINRNKLSRLTGIDNIVLYEIESGDIKNLCYNDVKKIADALDVNIYDLLGKKNGSDDIVFELIQSLNNEFEIGKQYLSEEQKQNIVDQLDNAIDIISNSIKTKDHDN